jgi:hypothetical protein
VRTELLVVEALLTQANAKASAGDWDGADEMLLQAAAVLDRLVTPAVVEAAGAAVAPAQVVETGEEKPLALAAAA